VRVAREPGASAERRELEPSAGAESEATAPEREAPISGESVGLAEMSDRFRNAALTAAIREGGFVCDDVVDAIRSADDVWIASCRNMINYRVDVTEERSLIARPVASYFDQVGPPPIRGDGFRIDRNGPVRLPPFPTK
jgi:hypothetical protein